MIVGESVNFQGGIDWLRDNGVEVVDLNSQECARMLADFIAANPAVWNEDIGEEIDPLYLRSAFPAAFRVMRK